MKKPDEKIIISPDAHSDDTIDFKFSDMKVLIKDIGLQYTYTLFNDEFIKMDI